MRFHQAFQVRRRCYFLFLDLLKEIFACCLMKNIFLLFIAIIFLKPALAQTNVYHPFPDSNAQWNYHWHQYCFWNGFGDDYYSFIISGDTIINALMYHKLNIFSVASVNPSCFSQVTRGYKGAFRQDTLLRKVFFIEQGASSEMLLYDFNMQVGDTVRGYTQTFSPYPDVVQSMDSVLVGSDYRKRWCINTCYFIYFIEGVGSTYGLICPSSGCVTDLWEYTLDCFSVSGQTLFPDTTVFCNIIDVTKNIPVVKPSVTLFPNPFHTSATLQIRDLDCEIKIYNSMGALVQDEIITRSDYILNRKSFPDGIYFYQLTTPKNEPIGSGRFIIE